MSDDILSRARAAAERINPGVEEALRARYDALLPGFAETLVETTFGRFYAREGADAKTRSLATVAALTALGGQTAPQLKIHVAGARRAGASQREIAEIIHQMALYGGYPAMINALNAAIAVFDAEDGEKSS